MILVSLPRLLLWIFWIGISVSIIYLNSLFNPCYNDSNAYLFFALLWLVKASALFTKLVGINEKVNVIESEQRKLEFRQQNKEQINSMIRLYKFQKAQEIQSKPDIDVQKLFEHIEAARKPWKAKRKSRYNVYEKEQHLHHVIIRLNNLISFTLLLLSLMTAIFVLNFSTLTSAIIVSYLPFLAIPAGIGLVKKSLVRQQEKIKEQIYP